MVDSPHHPEQEVIFTLGEAGVLDPDSDTKKKSVKSAKPSKLEAETKSDAKDAPESDSSVDVDSKTDDIPEVKVESKTDSVDADAKIEDIPEDSE